jgi:hypothetical protein
MVSITNNLSTVISNLLKETPAPTAGTFARQRAAILNAFKEQR